MPDLAYANTSVGRKWAVQGGRGPFNGPLCIRGQSADQHGPHKRANQGANRGRKMGRSAFLSFSIILLLFFGGGGMLERARPTAAGAVGSRRSIGKTTFYLKKLADN